MGADGISIQLRSRISSSTAGSLWLKASYHCSTIFFEASLREPPVARAEVSAMSAIQIVRFRMWSPLPRKQDVFRRAVAACNNHVDIDATSGHVFNAEGFSAPTSKSLSGSHQRPYAGSTERLTPTGCRGRLDRVQHAMAGDRVVECRAEMGSFAIVAGETRIRLGDVGPRALRRRPPVLLRHWQDLERGLRALAAADGQLEDLGLAAGGGELEIALGAVDLPEHVGAARNPAAIVDGERGPALEQPGDAHLIVRGHGLAFARSRDREGLPAHGHGGRELLHFAEAVTERVRGVADRDREHRRAVFPVVEIGVVRLHRRSPAHSRTDQRGGEHLTDVTLLDQITDVSHRRRRARLQSRNGEDALLLRQRGQAARLIEAVAKRPFAVDGLASIERGSRQLQVMRHSHGDGYDIHVGAVDDVLMVVERERHAKELAGGVGRFAPAGGQRRDLEVIRERLQSRNVRLRRPSTIRIGPDDAETTPLHVLLFQRSCFSAPPQATTWSSTVPRYFS